MQRVLYKAKNVVHQKIQFPPDFLTNLTRLRRDFWPSLKIAIHPTETKIMLENKPLKHISHIEY